jgi:hypothetical protein
MPATANIHEWRMKRNPPGDSQSRLTFGPD